MDGLLILLGGLALLFIALAPIGVMVLSRRVRLLSERLERLERQGVRPSHAAPELEAAPEPTAAAPEQTAASVGPWAAVQRARDRRTQGDQNDTMTEPPSQENDAVTPEHSVPGAFVMRRDKLVQGINWLRENWFLGVAALSLALAGVFLVQYGAEQGLLTPFARIIGALGLGVALIAGGEFVRRRYGDEQGTMQALPSTFSGAGIVTLFAAILAARHLYGMLPSDLALFALVAVAALSIVLGWFYGPFLAAVGIVGAFGAPFVVGGSSDAPHLFFYYFALIVVMALAIDAVRRWAWISVLALIGGFGATSMLLIGGAEAIHALGFALIGLIGATAIPVRRIWPDHSGSMLSDAALRVVRRSTADWPEFPTRLAGATFLASGALTMLYPLETAGLLEGGGGIWCLFTLGVLALFWMQRAPALQDLSLVAPVGLIALAVLLPMDGGDIYLDFIASPEAGVPSYKSAASVLSGLVAALAILAFWRTTRGVRASLIWSAASAFALPAMLGALELFWAPSGVIGAYPWAGHAIASAALMTLFAERAMRRWLQDLRPAALYAMSALSLITFALMLILSAAALSVAIGVMIVIAALIDRRLDMPWLGLFIQLGVAVLGWRFIVEPGVPWASWWNTPLWEVVLGYAVPLGLMALAWWILRPIRRVGAQLALESALWSLGAVFALILLERWLRSEIDSFWGLSLAGSVLLISMGAQLYRWRSGVALGWLRVILAGLLGVFGFGAILLALTVLSPLTSWGARDVAGPLLLDTIAVGYLVPALVLMVLAWKLDHLARPLRGAFAVIAAALSAGYIGLEIRRFWQGSEGMAYNAVSQGELYSYTIAMMIGSVALLFAAFARRSVVLRRLAMAGIAVTIAKVFLVDMGGLTGLIRVASFLGLGLALSGLAWLSRAMSARWDDGPEAAEPEPEPDQD